MKIRRFLTALLIVSMTFSLTACAGSNVGSSADSTDSVTSEAEKDEGSETSSTETVTKAHETTTTKAPETTTTKAPETTTTKAPETTTTKTPETTTTKTPETTIAETPEATITEAPETEPPPDGLPISEMRFSNITTGESYEMFNDTAIYTQADGWASFALGGHDVEGAEGCSIIAEIILDAAVCGSQTSHIIYDEYKPPSFFVHIGTLDGLVTINDADYPDNFGDCLIYFEYLDPLKEVVFVLDVMFVGGDGNTYRISGTGRAPFTKGEVPPERVYDETCIVCNGTGKCRVCNGSGWFSTVGDGIRCSSCYNYNGACIGCDGYGKH